MNKTMKLSLAVAATLLLNSNAMALPSAGQFVKLYNGDYGTTNGGEFKVDALENTTSVDYTSFCLETNEYITYGVSYKIDSVEDFAVNGGVGGVEEGKDYLEQKTKWVYWNYIQGTLGEKTDSLADTVQNVIWYLENEITALGSYQDTYNAWMTEGAEEDFTINGIVKVLNLSSNGVLKQSQIIGEAAPIPEPATMFLFGTGLVGLAGIVRRRQNI